VNAPQSQQLSIIATYAASRHMEKEALVATLLKTIAPDGASMEDIVGFLQIAHRFDLDPWAKEIFMIKSRGKVSTYVGIDGYSKIVNRQPEYDGCEFTYDQDPDGSITAVTCTMWRKDRTHPMAITEFYSECVPATPSEAWKRSPGRMLRHRAFVQAARLCFGISGALDEGTDLGTPMSVDTVDITPAASPVAPRRQPPSPSRAAFPNGSKPEPASETKSEDVSDKMEDAAFDIDGLVDAMEAAKDVNELKAIYQDYEVDENLQGQPELLDRAQNTFVRVNKRLAG
jgi:phage recombination protein Bet